MAGYLFIGLARLALLPGCASGPILERGSIGCHNRAKRGFIGFPSYSGVAGFLCNHRGMQYRTRLQFFPCILSYAPKRRFGLSALLGGTDHYAEHAAKGHLV